jgi:hypothetical protein
MTHGTPSIWTPELIAELTRLWEVDGFSLNEIGKRLNITRHQVKGKVRRLNLSARGNPVDIAKVKANRQSAADGRAHNGDGCRFPSWTHDTLPDRPEYGHYCGAPVLIRKVNGEDARSSYCVSHHALCIVPEKHPKSLRPKSLDEMRAALRKEVAEIMRGTL